jgi:excisionase family DNA binding protein
MEKYLKVKDVASRLNYNSRTILRWIHEGRIMAFQIGSGRRARYRIAETELTRIAAIGYEENMQVLKEQLKEV